MTVKRAPSGSDMVHIDEELQHAENIAASEGNTNTGWTLPTINDPFFLPWMVVPDSLFDEDNDKEADDDGSSPAETNISQPPQTKTDFPVASEEKACVPDDISSKNKTLTAVERRRKRNREALRRARQRKHEEVEEMKETLQALEERYQQLCDRSQGRSVGCNHRQIDSSYYDLVDVSHHLQNEMYTLKQTLMHKQKLQWRVEQQLDRLDPLANLERFCADYEYVPITKIKANECARQWFLHLQTLEEIAKPLSYPSSNSDDDDRRPQSIPLRPCFTFGWAVSCKFTDENHFFANFSKYFPGISPGEMIQKSWTQYSKPDLKPLPSRHVVRYEILQDFGESGCVVSADVLHPVKDGKLMRWIHLVFRLQTDQGFVLIQLPLNPKSLDLRPSFEDCSPFEYIDGACVIEFISENDDTSGVEVGCLIKWSVLTEYDTQEDMYLRLLNSLHARVVWENAILPSPLKLLP